MDKKQDKPKGKEEENDQKKTCPVNFEVPPEKVPFGSLAEKEEKKAPGAGVKKRESLSFPKDKPPKGVQFPFLVPTESAQRILQTKTEGHDGNSGRSMGRIQVGREKIVFPGWLIELDDAKLNVIMELKGILTSGKKLCDLIDPVCKQIGQLGVEVVREEIVEILRRTSAGENKISFPLFMLAAGNPKLAREKGVLQEPLPFKEEDCADGDTAGNNKKGKQQKQQKPDQKETLNRLYQPYKYEKVDTWPLTEEQAKRLKKNPPKEPEDGVDKAVYSLREKVFFSGLLIFEMYHTIRSVEDLYFKSENIPIPKDKIFKDLTRRGFGVEDAGTRKLGFAEWDRPLPKVPKASPYVATLPLVATRWKITKPNESERRRTLTQIQPIHLAVQPPKKTKGPGLIKVKENQGRIKETMEYLASTGNCVAMLPYAHCIVHLSDTFIQKLEEITVHDTDGPPPQKLYPSNDLTQLKREVKELLYLHGLPPKINKMKHLIDFNCAMCLRKICKSIRDNHWEFISERQVGFRNRAWQLMHVDRIPCGPIRENFVYTFDTYLPYKSDLPMVSNTTPLPL